MKKIKAIINKSIGNSYILTVDDKFYDIINKQAACGLLNCMPAHLGNPYNTSVSITQMKDIAKTRKYLDLIDEEIHWIDRKRTISSILRSEEITSSRVGVKSHTAHTMSSSCVELLNPTFKYYLSIGKLELCVHRFVFLVNKVNVTITNERAL